MKYDPRIHIQAAEVVLELQDQRSIRFSSQLPARVAVGDGGYSEKGWLWCAFQEALVKADVKLEEAEELFESIWRRLPH